MKNGFRVYDSDTHINPAAEILDKYVDPDFRGRLPELAPYRAPSGDMHNYRAGTKFYRRILGEEAPRETFTGRESRWMGSRKPRPGTQDDQADNRVMDMDDEGADVHFLIPTSWLSLVGVDDTSIEVGLIRAFHRHMAEFCGSHPDRLKGPIVASTRRVDEAVREIREWGKAKWAVAVMPLLAEGLPADHPSLEPIWREAQEHDLPIANHSFTWTPPYIPATATSTTTSSWAGSPRIRGARCGSPRPSSAAGCLIVTRSCGWACWNAASVGCRSGRDAWTSRRSTSAALRL